MLSLVKYICSVVRARDAVSCERGASLSCLGDASLPGCLCFAPAQPFPREVSTLRALCSTGSR